MTRRTTIKDVAALAGVSFATVSRALDDHPDISQETKEKVRAACAQLGYVPNGAARGLTGQSTHTIGVIVPDVSNPYFSDMATAIEQAAAERGYRMLLSNSMRDTRQELHAIEGFLCRRIDGILISPLSPDTQEAHRAALGDLPCVYIGINHDGQCSYVAGDNYAGAYRATRYLLDLGHRDLVYLGGRERSRTREQRAMGFRKALDEAGLTGREYILSQDQADSGRQWSYDIALELFRQRPGVVRSLHPTHSMAAYGKGAAAYLEGELDANTPCTPGGCYDRLRAAHGKVLLLGVTHARNTFIHSVEEVLNVPNRLTDKPMQMTVVDEAGAQHNVYMLSLIHI